MKITKYAHACLLLEKDGTALLIDPGSFTELPGDLPKIDFVIVTEEHYDHFNLDNLKQVARLNPEVKICTTESVKELLKDAGLNVHAISGDQTEVLGMLKVTFSETDHAVVYKKSPCKSLAILIEDALSFPSDSYKTVDKKVKVLALPTSGPWFKVSECIDFVNTVDSETVLATHNALNSKIGNDVTHNYIVNNLGENRKFVHLADGERIDV